MSAMMQGMTAARALGVTWKFLGTRTEDDEIVAEVEYRVEIEGVTPTEGFNSCKVGIETKTCGRVGMERGRDAFLVR
jgi:hypothetical protein